MHEKILENWVVQVRKGILELCVLNSLTAKPLYGYDIVKKLSSIDGIAIPEGTIYPILSRFKRDLLVDTTIEESQEGPARKYYHLTRLGKSLVDSMNQHWTTLESAVNFLRMEANS